MEKRGKIPMRKRLIPLTLILLFSFFSFLPVNAEKTKGDISFQPNIIPELQISFVEEFFRFKWRENRFDLKLLIHSEGKNYSLRDFWEKTGRLVNWEQLSSKATDSMYEFGYMITDIPKEIADNVEYLVWKIEGASFDVEAIELENIAVFEEGYNITRFHLPDNLVLSYEDLWLYDFTVSHPNKLETKVHGVKGKSSWNLDPITFSGGVITITNYDTEGGACDHNEIYTQIANDTIFKKNGNQYYSNARIVIGNGTGSTWFVDSDVQVSFNSSAFSANYQIAYEVKTNSHLRFGVLTDATEKLGKWGVDVYLKTTGYLLGFSFIYGQNGEILLYSSHFRYYNPTWSTYGARLGFKGNGRVWDCLLDHTEIWAFTGSTVDVYEIIFTTKSGINVYGGSPTISRISLYDSGTNTPGKGLCFYLDYSGNVENLYMRKTGALNSIYAQDITVDHNITDTDLDKWTIKWVGASTAEIFRQYTFDLTVTTASNVPIEDANVTLTYYGQGGGTHGTWITDANGEIPEQTVTAGFYNQTGGNTIYDYNPYEITITKADYLTYQRNFTQLEEKSWNIALLEEVDTITFNSTYYLLGFVTVLPFLLFALAYKRRGVREEWN